MHRYFHVDEKDPSIRVSARHEFSTCGRSVRTFCNGLQPKHGAACTGMSDFMNAR